MNAELSDELIAILDQEREALALLDFGVLAELSIKKEELSEKLNSSRPTIEKNVLSTIKRKTHENGAIFEASLRGMKTAMDRIADVRQSYGHLKTYNGQGHVSTQRTMPPSVSKKA